MVANEKQENALQDLANIYLGKYPIQVQSKELEVSGCAVRTENVYKLREKLKSIYNIISKNRKENKGPISLFNFFVLLLMNE